MITVVDIAKVLGGFLLILSGVYLFNVQMPGPGLADILVGAYLLWTCHTTFTPPGV